MHASLFLSGFFPSRASPRPPPTCHDLRTRACPSPFAPSDRIYETTNHSPKHHGGCVAAGSFTCHFHRAHVLDGEEWGQRMAGGRWRRALGSGRDRRLDEKNRDILTSEFYFNTYSQYYTYSVGYLIFLRWILFFTEGYNL